MQFRVVDVDGDAPQQAAAPSVDPAAMVGPCAYVFVLYHAGHILALASPFLLLYCPAVHRIACSMRSLMMMTQLAVGAAAGDGGAFGEGGLPGGVPTDGPGARAMTGTSRQSTCVLKRRQRVRMLSVTDVADAAALVDVPPPATISLPRVLIHLHCLLSTSTSVMSTKSIEAPADWTRSACRRTRGAHQHHWRNPPALAKAGSRQPLPRQ